MQLLAVYSKKIKTKAIFCNTIKMIIKIARRTTGAKGCYFFAGFLQETPIFLKQLLKFCSKSLKSLLQVSNKLLTNILRSLFLVPNKALTYHDSSLKQVSNMLKPSCNSLTSSLTRL